MALINYLTTIRLDYGALAGLGEDLAAVGISRPLIVADAGVAAAGLLDRVRAAWPGGAQAPAFLDTPSNPTEEAVEQALALYGEHGCDGMLALGGGSPMDLAKAVALADPRGPRRAPYALVEGGAR